MGLSLRSGILSPPAGRVVRCDGSPTTTVGPRAVGPAIAVGFNSRSPDEAVDDQTDEIDTPNAPNQRFDRDKTRFETAFDKSFCGGRDSNRDTSTWTRWVRELEHVDAWGHHGLDRVAHLPGKQSLAGKNR